MAASSGGKERDERQVVVRAGLLTALEVTDPALGAAESALAQRRAFGQQAGAVSCPISLARDNAENDDDGLTVPSRLLQRSATAGATCTWDLSLHPRNWPPARGHRALCGRRPCPPIIRPHGIVSCD